MMAYSNTHLWAFCTKNAPVYINEHEINLGSDKSDHIKSSFIGIQF